MRKEGGREGVKEGRCCPAPLADAFKGGLNSCEVAPDVVAWPGARGRERRCEASAALLRLACKHLRPSQVVVRLC